MGIFDILGPVMVGPSSSHTAGAVRIGYAAREILGEEVAEAEIFLHGSFADTGIGHGTDRALLGGILGMATDDERISVSFDIAKEVGLKYSFSTINLNFAHPNTALVKLTGKSGKQSSVQASSIGGGRINVDFVNGVEMHFSGEYPTLIVESTDRPGFAAKVASFLAFSEVNIATINLCRMKRGGNAIMVMEIDKFVPQHIIDGLKSFADIREVTYIDIYKNGGDK